MLTKILLFSLLQTIYSVVTKFSVTSCETNTDLMQDVILSVVPELPQTDYTLYLNGDLNKVINKGTSNYAITYNFIPLSPTIEDLCADIKESNISCPLTSGPLSSESKGKIPDNLSGSVTIKNEWYDEEQKRILCMLFNIKL